MTKELRNFTLKSIENIQKAIENNKLIIFVGAGVSRNSGIPTWAELIRELAKDLGIRAKGKDSEGNEVFGNDEFLKIPQYYYNERKEKEYYDKIKEVLDKDFQPNEIHKIIFELNPTHIITTNYDNLLEKQARQIQTNIKYCKAANDIELSTAPNCNFIIKMHGEFNNIVLKESDYDSYSNNFKLTETYVKGLFATHTILFIGFSAEDSNIRRILQWIKDIIGDKHQPAYLIDVNDHSDISEEEFRIKFEYYKNQGIFTLYKSQIEDEIKTTFNNFRGELNLKDLGLDLYKFLFFIKNYQHFDVNKYYCILKQLESFNVINNEILGKVFNVKVPLRFTIGGASFPLETKQQTYEIDILRLKMVIASPKDLDNNLKLLRYNSLLNEEENKIINKFDFSHDKLSIEQKKELRKIIKKLSKQYNLSQEEIQKINYISHVIKNAQLTEQKIIVNSNIIHYNFEEDYNESELKGVNIFKKAFYYYKTNKFAEAFRELEIISKNYIDNPILYYIAEFNKKTLAIQLKWNSGWYNYTNEEKNIAKEYENINLEFIINNKIPESIKPVMKLLTIDNVQRECMNIINIAEEISDYKFLIENGGSSTKNNTYDLYKKLYSFFNFMTGNYLFLNGYKQTNDFYYYAIKAILVSYSIEEPEEKSFFNFGIRKVPYFDYYDFYIIIEYLKNKTLKSLIKIYEIKEFCIETNSINYIKDKLIKSFDSLLRNILNSSNIDFIDKISNFLTIFGLINFKHDELKVIVSTYTRFIKEYEKRASNIDHNNFRGSIHKILADFVASITNFYINNNIDLPFLLYEEIIDSFKDVWTIDVSNYARLIKNCIFALYEDENYILTKQNLIDFYLENINNIECSDEILVFIYKFADDKHKNVIAKHLRKKYQNFTLNNYYVFLNAILENIIPYTKSVEDNLIILTKDTLSKKLKQNKESDSSNEPILVFTNIIFDLIIHDKFIQTDIVYEILNDLELAADKLLSNKQNLLNTIRRLKIVLEPEKFNYSNADIRDFIYFNKPLLNKIKSNPKNKKEVLKIFFRDFNTNKTKDFNKKKFLEVYNYLLE